jgi:outer membrane lipoprotein-sorting protein
MVRAGLWVLIGLVSACAYGPALGDEPQDIDDEALRIVKEVDRIMGLEDIRSRQRMTIYRKDDSEREYVMDVMTSGTDRAFAEIIEPPREKGRQMLKLGDVVWSYLPSVKKSIRVAGRSKFMGGDFENNDVLRLDLVEDYVPRIAEDLPDQYVLELEGKDLSLTYAKVKIWVDKATFQPSRQEYFTISGKLVKSASFSEIRRFDGVTRPAVIEMRSALSPKKRTVLDLIEFSKGVKNPEKVFLRSNLGK